MNKQLNKKELNRLQLNENKILFKTTIEEIEKNNIITFETKKSLLKEMFVSSSLLINPLNV